ncbi:hypothetical protein LCGC14_1388710 [marine sediment metagenome]|uniref:DNA-directed DNA polymerase family A palm domain-containing protein n=1 Tax=marine sediment metagenome TaxID=412755 RepID=A0A0F9N250_9ZZZZ
MHVLQLYHDAHKITHACALQRRIFSHWRHHCDDPVYECMAFDTETTSLQFHTPSNLKHKGNIIVVNNPFPFGISLCIPYKDELALFWARMGTYLYDAALELLQEEGEKCAHNARYDIRVLHHAGTEVAPNIGCTLTMSRIGWDRREHHSLQRLSEFICPEMSDWEVELTAVMRNIRASHTRRGFPKSYSNYSFIPDKTTRKYAMIDSFMCWIINLKLRPVMLKEDCVTYDREIALLPLVRRIEERGMLFDTRRARKELRRLDTKLTAEISKVQRLAGTEFNPNSPAKLLPVLLECGILKKDLTIEGTLTTNKKALERFLRKQPAPRPKLQKLVRAVLTMRSIRTLTTRYYAPLIVRARWNNGIIYYTINPADTKTSRMTGSNPNMQFVPRPTSGYEGGNHVRGCFKCRAGYRMYFFDWSVMELIAFGIIAGSINIIKWFKAGEDLHVKMGKRIFGSQDVTRGNLVGTREVTKHVSYAYIFGAGVGGLMRDFLMLPDEAADCLERYKEAFPEFEGFKNRCKHELRVDGYITDLYGKRYHITPQLAYLSVNAVVQGTCASALKEAATKIDESFENCEDRHILLPLHDEIIIERRISPSFWEDLFVDCCKINMEEISVFMSRGLRLRVDAEYTTTNWEEKEPYICMKN